jgi:hypothetical protein
LTDKSGDLYVGSFPALDAGSYTLDYMEQGGVAPAVGDSRVASGGYEWSGLAEVTPSSYWGAGAYSVTITVRTTGGTPITGAQTWVNSTNVSSGAVTAAVGTNGSGQVTVRLATGTYYVFCYKEGYSFLENGASNRITVTGTGTHVVDIGAVAVAGVSVYYARGFLERAITAFRESTDEPQVNKKYTTDRVIAKLEGAYATVYGELKRISGTPIVARYNITIQEGVEKYALPPTVGSVLGVYAESTGGYKIFYKSHSRLNPMGRGVWLEGRTLHVQAGSLSDAAVLTVEYTPTSPRLLEGTCSVDATGLVVTLGLTYRGTRDTRVQAYAGCMFRILGDTQAAYDVVQERNVEGYDAVTGVVTLDVALSPNPYTGGGTTYFEVAPAIPVLMDMVVPLYAAYGVMVEEGMSERAALLKRAHYDAMRGANLAEFYSDMATVIARADNHTHRRYRERVL